MLKKRIIGVVLVKNGIVVQSIGFCRYMPVGQPSITIEFLNKWDIDEIVLLNIDGDVCERIPNYKDLRKLCEKCHVPLSVGGGIREVSHIETLIRNGADKVIINSSAFRNREIISRGAEIFGRQCIVASLDVFWTGEFYDVRVDGGLTSIDMELEKAVQQVVADGAGEILLTSINRDGKGNGYDLDLLRKVIDVVNVPVIASGGAGNPVHFYQAFKAGAFAVAAANFFHFTEHSVVLNKRFLLERERNLVRLDTNIDYQDQQVGNNGRLNIPNEDRLAKLRFEYIPTDII